MATAVKRILCPIDYGEPSMAALDLALNLAMHDHAKLELLHVAPLPLGESRLSPVPMEPFPFQEETHRKELERIGRECIDGKADYQVSVTAGDPGAGIVRAIRQLGADLVVIGTHGRKGFGHLVLGSVAEYVVRESPVPVLTVRARTGVHPQPATAA